MDNEKVLLAVREHWFRLFTKLAVVGLCAILPFFLTALFGLSTESLSDKGVRSLVTLAWELYFLGILLATFVVIVVYYLNIHIVSEERILDIDQTGLLNHKISELNIESLQDVSARTVGLFGNIFDYGTVYIQTAGATERFQFENVPHPAMISKLILEVFEQQIAKNNKPV